MKLFLSLLTFLILIQGCGEKNAFSRFNLSNQQELGLNSLQSSKLKSGKNVNGVVSVIYLNQIEPDRFKSGEVFYVFMYTKDKSLPLIFRLNGMLPSYSVKELKNENDFTYLTSVDTDWNRYFIVTFPKQGDKLNFKVSNGNFSSDVLKFEKDE